MGRSLMQALALAVLQIRNKRHEFMTLEHILLAVTFEKTGQRILAACNIDIHELRHNLEQYLEENMTTVAPEDKGEIVQTPAVTRVLERCLREQAQTNKQAEIGNFLIHLYSEQDSWAAYFIKKQGVILAHIKDIVSREAAKFSQPADNIIISDINEITNPEDVQQYKNSLQKNPGEAKEEKQSALDLFAVDLIAKANNGKSTLLSDAEMNCSAPSKCFHAVKKIILFSWASPEQEKPPLPKESPLPLQKAMCLRIFKTAAFSPLIWERCSPVQNTAATLKTVSNRLLRNCKSCPIPFLLLMKSIPLSEQAQQAAVPWTHQTF